MTAGVAHEQGAMRHVRALVGAAHIGPGLAVTVLAGLLAAAQGLGPGTRRPRRGGGLRRSALDRLEQRPHRPRPRPPGRTRPTSRWRPARSPSASYALACIVAVVACVVLSLALGLAAGLLHLGCVASAWAYNLGLKSTVWSWVPYAVSFGGLTAVVTLADGEAPPWWWPVGAALLGVGAHLLNVLPDLDDDAATGVRGLPHRLGPRRIAPVAAAVLVAASAVVLVGAAPPVAVTVAAAAAVLGLAVRRGERVRPTALRRRGGHRPRRHPPAGGRPMTAETWDVVVVGAGPAGACAALGALAEDPSLRVLLLDRSDFPRDKSCGDGIAPHVLDALATVGAADVVDGWAPLRDLELSHGDAMRRRADAARGARRPPGRLRRAAGRAGRGRRRRPAPPPRHLDRHRPGDRGADPVRLARRRGRRGRRRRRLAGPRGAAGPPPRDAGHRDPRLRTHHARARGTPDHPLRQPPAAVVRLGVRPRRRARQRRLRRAAARRTRQPSSPQPTAAARPARGARPGGRRNRWPLARAPPAAERMAVGPARRSGPARRRRRRTGQPDDR